MDWRDPRDVEDLLHLVKKSGATRFRLGEFEVEFPAPAPAYPTPDDQEPQEDPRPTVTRESLLRDFARFPGEGQ